MTSGKAMSAVGPLPSRVMIPFDNVDYPPIPKDLLGHLVASLDGTLQSTSALGDAESRRELSRMLGFVLESEISFFRSTWQVAQWLALNLKSEKNASVAFSCFEPESLVIPFANSLKARGFQPQLVPLDDSFDPMLDLLGQARKKGPMLFLMSLVQPITGRITKATEVIKAVHDLGGLVVADATHHVQRLGQSLAVVDSDLTLVRSRPLLAPDGVVIAYLSRRMREMLKRDADASASWRSMSSLDAPREMILPTVESIKFLVSLAGRRKAELEHNRAILDGLEDLKNVSIVGPREITDRASIFTLEVSGLEPGEVALMLDSAANLAVSVVRPGMGSSKACSRYPQAGAIRASPFVNNTGADVEAFVAAMRNIASSVR